MSKCPVGFRRHKQKCVRVRASVAFPAAFLMGLGANVKPLVVARLFVIARASRTSAIAAGKTSDGLIVLPNGRVGEGEPMLDAAKRLLAVDGWALNEGANDAEFIAQHTVDFPVRGKNYRWILVPGGARWVGTGEPTISTPAALLHTGRGNSDGRVMHLMDMALGHRDSEISTQYSNAELRKAREIYEQTAEAAWEKRHTRLPGDPDTDAIDENEDLDERHDAEAGFVREAERPVPTEAEYFALREEARRKADEFEAAEAAVKAEKRAMNLRRLAAKGTPGAAPKPMPTLVDFKALRRRIAYQTPTEIAIWVGKKNADPLPLMVHKGQDTFIRGREVFDKAGKLAYVWYVLEGTEPNISLKGLDLGSFGAESEDDDDAVVSAPAIKKKTPAVETPKWPSPAIRIPVEELPFTPTEDLPFERTASGQPKRLSPSEQEVYFAFEEVSPTAVHRYYRFDSSWLYTGFIDSKRNLTFRNDGFETRFGTDFLVFTAKREAVEGPVLRAVPRRKVAPSLRTKLTKPDAPDPVARAVNAKLISETLKQNVVRVRPGEPESKDPPKPRWATTTPPLEEPWPAELASSTLTPTRAELREAVRLEAGRLSLQAASISFRHFRYAKTIRFEGMFEGFGGGGIHGSIALSDVRALTGTNKGAVALPVQWQSKAKTSHPEAGVFIVSPGMSEMLITWAAKLANEQLGKLSGAGSWGPNARPVR